MTVSKGFVFYFQLYDKYHSWFGNKDLVSLARELQCVFEQEDDTEEDETEEDETEEDETEEDETEEDETEEDETEEDDDTVQIEMTG